MGPMIQQIQQPCQVAGCHKGTVCSRKNVKEVLEVHIPRGASNGHKLTFYEMGDEIPDGAAGDVFIVLDVQEHAVFKRKGCDLYLRRDISLVEALCGFSMEIDHLDGRKLLVKTDPGDISKPIDYDPFADDDENQEWVMLENTQCTLDPMAQAELDDVEKLKQVISKGQLRGKGIAAFAIHQGQTVFFAATPEEVNASTAPRRGSRLYVMADDASTSGKRMMKCLVEQGLPAPSNPMLIGNLFLMLNIVFPDQLEPGAEAALRAALPPALHTPTISEDEAEVIIVGSEDPVASFKATDIPDEHGDDDEDEGGGQRVQCAQQ